MTLQDDVNILTSEVQAREPFVTSALAGYDGDPNAPAAPDILDNAPLGTWYHRTTLDLFYRKDIAGVWTEQGGGSGGSGGGVVTEEDLTFLIDYEDAGAVDPDATTVFTTQDQVDDFLSAAGATNFKHVQKVADALPKVIAHAVTISCTAGVHRPPALGETNLNTAFTVIESGSLTITGEADSSTWTSLHAGGTITGHQTLDEVTGVPDPYLDFAGSTFPNDGSLQGKYAVTSDGFASVIWDHTDSRLWVCKKLSPVPTDAVSTCFVAEPSTIFRSSMDDLVTSKPSGIPIQIVGTGHTEIFVGLFLNNITVEPFGNGFASVRLDFPHTFMLSNFLHINKTTGPNEESAGLWVTKNSALLTNDLSVLTTVGGGADNVFSIDDSTLVTNSSYFQGGDDGNSVRGPSGLFSMNSTVIRGGGGDFGPALEAFAGGRIDFIEQGAGVRNTMMETDNGEAAIVFRGKGDSFTLPTNFHVVRFRDNTGPCIRLGDDASLIVPLGDGFLDDGGNLDVGIEFAGSGVNVKLPANTDVTGANGDVRFAGSIEDYATLVADGPFVDFEDQNRLEQL